MFGYITMYISWKFHWNLIIRTIVLFFCWREGGREKSIYRADLSCHIKKISWKLHKLCMTLHVIYNFAIWVYIWKVKIMSGEEMHPQTKALCPPVSHGFPMFPYILLPSSKLQLLYLDVPLYFPFSHYYPVLHRNMHEHLHKVHYYQLLFFERRSECKTSSWVV